MRIPQNADPRYTCQAAALAIGVVALWLLSRFFWESQHPAASAARRMQSAEASEPLKAIRELEGSGRADSAVAIPALINCLKDPDAQVRAAAAMAMVSVVSGVGTTRPATMMSTRR